MFSVIIPLYNKELSVRRTVQSVVDQSFVDLEIIVVNDGSTDSSLEIVQKIDDPRLRIIDKLNGGVSSARNSGIKEAKFPWIVFLDGDDLWKDNHLYTLWEMIVKHPHERVFCTSYVRSNQSIPRAVIDSIEVIEDYFKKAIQGHFFWTSVACIHFSVFGLVGNFNEKYNRGEDLDLWARIGRKYRFIQSKKVTAIYRIDAENRSNQSFQLEKSRIFNYDRNDASSDSELDYYRKQIVDTLKFLLRRGAFRNFFKLRNKHKYLVGYTDLFN